MTINERAAKIVEILKRNKWKVILGGGLPAADYAAIAALLAGLNAAEIVALLALIGSLLGGGMVAGILTLVVTGIVAAITGLGIGCYFDKKKKK
ncbi:MAG: hypothetical protein WCB46_10320 [Methanoregula sp.]